MGRAGNILKHFVWAGSFCLLLSACTVTETIKDFLSSTTPGDWFTGDGLLRADQKVNAFVALNFENVKMDMARGRGEYLTSLSELMEVPQARRASFFAHAQSQYAFVNEKRSSPQEVLALLTAPATMNE